MDSEMKEVSDLQTQISEFAEKMSLSQRAIATLSKVHRAVCMTSAPARQSRND
jgi:predicted XRE-type DNA-binding protein